ncbi:hypothetical protein PQX77_008772 [Marasmius sp. AFHP31]|nr:hypothetical protein PQX77_008772 [Marasmius sp. AFHP31]
MANTALSTRVAAPLLIFNEFRWVNCRAVDLGGSHDERTDGEVDEVEVDEVVKVGKTIVWGASDVLRVLVLVVVVGVCSLSSGNAGEPVVVGGVDGGTVGAGAEAFLDIGLHAGDFDKWELELGPAIDTRGQDSGVLAGDEFGACLGVVLFDL